MFGLTGKKTVTLEEGKYAKGKQYQYIKGDKFNSLVEIESYKSPYVNFSDGSRITHELFDEYLVESETVDKDFSIENLKPNAILKNQHEMQNLNNQSVINLSANLPITEEKRPEIISDSPVTMILQKQTPEEVKFEVTIKVKVPDKNLISVLSSSFGEEDTIRDLYKYVFSQIDFNEFKDDIQLSVQKYYNITKKEIKKDKNEKGKVNII